jgi:hypothetical protein
VSRVVRCCRRKQHRTELPRAVEIAEVFGFDAFTQSNGIRNAIAVHTEIVDSRRFQKLVTAAFYLITSCPCMLPFNHVPFMHSRSPRALPPTVSKLSPRMLFYPIVFKLSPISQFLSSSHVRMSPSTLATCPATLCSQAHHRYSLPVAHVRSVCRTPTARGTSSASFLPHHHPMPLELLHCAQWKGLHNFEVNLKGPRDYSAKLKGPPNMIEVKVPPKHGRLWRVKSRNVMKPWRLLTWCEC